MKCPHCLIAIHAEWSAWSVEEKGTSYLGAYEEYSKTDFHVESTLCPACKRLIFQLVIYSSLSEPVEAEIPPLDKIIVYPTSSSRKVSLEVDERFAKDFREACKVVSTSQKASAALSRRCLQSLLREKTAVKPGTLAEEIREAIRKSHFPEDLATSLEAVRTIGNFAAHPIKNQHTGEVIDVEPGEAEWLLDTLEELFDFYFVQPAKMKRRIRLLNEKLDAAAKPILEHPQSRGSRD